MSTASQTSIERLAHFSHPENRADLADKDLGHLLAKVMIVDDEPINVKVVRKHLQGAGYVNFITTTDSTTAMDTLREQQPDVVLLDVMMPRVNGLQILQWIREDDRFGHMPVLILTASTDAATKLSALELGATDFLAKPVDPHDLLPRLRNVLIVKAHQDYLAGYSARLEREVQRRTSEVESSRLRVIQCLARAGEYRDDTTGKHVFRVGRCAALIATQLGYTPAAAMMVELAAQLHDIGKIGIPDAILLKPGKLTPEEYSIMKRHCEYGKAIIDPTNANEAELARQYQALGLSPHQRSESPIITMAAAIALTHHERFNGTGYPNGLSGENIPLEGRITAIVDVFDALRSPRPYKSPFTVEKSLEILKSGRGTEFDPKVHEAMMAALPELAKVYEEYGDDESSTAAHPA